ncbi:tyrosine-type recombinase/integrase [Paenibacillus sp. LHD-38]|uniref:tyrosine-type recombinase/integrase n=1 Tax=Paenibacillus sp. LHD-38 TaxID=3072143 RepID=UPI00280C9A2A|nr:tyrosine-type recombinase/integrase [Paenibacillus sp. LHD-38]MDQ8737933.1 tyrosine-type recombinase/integrase [Paenibacillus sp. LHD-38]
MYLFPSGFEQTAFSVRFSRRAPPLEVFLRSLFTSLHPRRWSLRRLAFRGEIEANVYPRRFRHTYACQLLDNGAPLDFIQGMLGHEKASTTQIYAQLRGERGRELYRSFF